MPKKCEHKRPTIKVTMHVPATSWHPHMDKVLEVKAETEFQTWALAMRDSLLALTHENLRLMVGYWGDALNSLPTEARTALITVIAQGLGLSIKAAEGVPDTIEISLVPRYEPLVGEKKTESGLVIPKNPENPDLILPGDERYTEGR